MTGTNAMSATRLARETGFRQQTLSLWLREARNLPTVPPPKKPKKTWTLDEKVRILGTAAKLTGEELSAFLTAEGLQLSELERWRLALDEDGSSLKSFTSRVRKLERELARKDKALAEAAALLVLKKKLQDAFGDEDDDTDEENEK